MNAPAIHETQSTLELALIHVHATLTDLLVAADEQYQAVVERDQGRLESVTRVQERLASRLQRAERQRTEALAGRSLKAAIVELPRSDALRAVALARRISLAVRGLQAKNTQTSLLLEASLELGTQTINFLHRLVGAEQAPSYGARGY